MGKRNLRGVRSVACKWRSASTEKSRQCQRGRQETSGASFPVRPGSQDVKGGRYEPRQRHKAQLGNAAISFAIRREDRWLRCVTVGVSRHVSRVVVRWRQALDSAEGTRCLEYRICRRLDQRGSPVARCSRLEFVALRLLDLKRRPKVAHPRAVAKFVAIFRPTWWMSSFKFVW